MDHALAIKQFIVSEFAPDIQVDQLSDEYDLIESGVIDSLRLLRVITWLGTYFDIPIDEVEFNELDFVSVGAICRFVDRETRRVPVAGTAAER